MRSAVIVLGVGLSIVVASCASAPATPATPSSAPTAAAKAAPVPADIARAGVITVGIPANPNLMTGKDANGLPQGVAPDLINALATRMGVKLVWADLTDGAKAVQNIQSGAWDIALASPDAAGTESLAFVGYLEINHTLLVPGTSAIRSFADADKPGLKIWVQRGAPVERTLTRAVKSATIVLKEPWLTVAAFQADLKAGGWDAYAQNRQGLLFISRDFAGTRVIDDRFGATTQSLGVKKERAELVAYLNDFMVEAKYSGLIKRSIETFKIQGVQPAP